MGTTKKTPSSKKASPSTAKTALPKASKNTKKNTQVYNPATGHYIMRDAETGKFVKVKSDGHPFKGLEKEKTVVVEKARLPVKGQVRAGFARAAEQAVIDIKNKKKERSSAKNETTR